MRSMKRLAKDHVQLRRAVPPNYFFPSTDASSTSLPDDLTHLLIALAGPHGTPYSDGIFNVSLSIPLTYPDSPPTATFRTRIFHPNVAEETGAVCLETLKRDWDPKLTLKDILITISCLLIQPNPDSALNQKAGALIQDDYAAFEKQARLMTRIHAQIPEGLIEAAEEARMRGEEGGEVGTSMRRLQVDSKPPLQDTTTQNENHATLDAQDVKRHGEYPRKRSIAEVAVSPQKVMDEEGRRRKSPRFEHSRNESVGSAGCAVVEAAAQLQGQVFSAKAACSAPLPPAKVVFKAQWRVARTDSSKTKARIGIRRL